MNDSNTELDDRLRKVELLILDVDGVLTDGKLYYGSGGLELKAFNVQDGHAIKMLQAEIPVAIISGRTSDVVERRAAELGIAHLFQGVDDKPVALAELSKRTGIAPGRIAHMGDDIPDIALFAEVGLAIAPASAHPEVLAQADLVTQLAGGEGAVREVCQRLLVAMDRWDP